MEQYYDLVLLLLGFGAFVGAWIFIEGKIREKRNKARPSEVSANNERIVHSHNVFLVFYGINIRLDPTDYSEQERCSDGSDSRCLAAKNLGLETFSDRLTDGEDYFLYIGKNLGLLGLQYIDYNSLTGDALREVVAQVDEKLSKLDYPETPALHLQSIYQY